LLNTSFFINKNFHLRLDLIHYDAYHYDNIFAAILGYDPFIDINYNYLWQNAMHLQKSLRSAHHTNLNGICALHRIPT